MFSATSHHGIVSKEETFAGCSDSILPPDPGGQSRLRSRGPRWRKGSRATVEGDKIGEEMEEKVGR